MTNRCWEHIWSYNWTAAESKHYSCSRRCLCLCRNGIVFPLSIYFIRPLWQKLPAHGIIRLPTEVGWKPNTECRDSCYCHPVAWKTAPHTASASHKQLPFWVLRLVYTSARNIESEPNRSLICVSVSTYVRVFLFCSRLDYIWNLKAKCKWLCNPAILR